MKIFYSPADLGEGGGVERFSFRIRHPAEPKSPLLY